MAKLGHFEGDKAAEGAIKRAIQDVNNKIVKGLKENEEPVCCGAGVVRAGEDPLTLTDKVWQERLTPDQFQVCRQKGTERAFSGELVNNDEKGVYRCSCCGAELFSSSTKYDSGSGWPSFYKALYTEGKDESKTNILRHQDYSHGMSREEVVCKRCDAHLGHVFPDGPAPTGQRFCMNSVSLTFEPAGKRAVVGV